MSEWLLLMINVRRAELKLPHCLPRRARGCCCPPACLEELCCVSGCHGSALYVLSPLLPPSLSPSPSPALSSPPSLPSTRPLQATLDVVMNLQFHYIEKLWQTFWCSTPPSSDGSTAVSNRSESAALVSFVHLCVVCSPQPPPFPPNASVHSFRSSASVCVAATRIPRVSSPGRSWWLCANTNRSGYG